MSESYNARIHVTQYWGYESYIRLNGWDKQYLMEEFVNNLPTKLQDNKIVLKGMIYFEGGVDNIGGPVTITSWDCRAKWINGDHHKVISMNPQGKDVDFWIDVVVTLDEH